MAHPRPVIRIERRGAAAVEFALVLPILLTLVFAVIDMSWYMHMCTAVQDAIRRGVRAGSVFPIEDTVVGICLACEQAASQTTVAGLEALGLDASTAVTTATTALVDGSWAIQVNVSAPYNSLTQGFLPMPTSIDAQLAWRIENQGAN